MRSNFKLKLALLAFISMVFAGCVTTKNAPISSLVTEVNTSQQSIGVMTVTVSNKVNSLHQPSLKWIEVTEDANNEKNRTKITELISEEKSLNKKYLVSFQVKSGNTTMTKIFARSFSFPLFGMFEMPIYYNVKIPPNKVVYLGHLNTQILNKARGDLPAGPITPLIDQALVGASTGTFKINYEDKYDEDIEFVKQAYPIFKPIDIVNMSPPMAN